MKKGYIFLLFSILMFSVSAFADSPSRLNFPGPFNDFDGNPSAAKKAIVETQQGVQKFSPKSITDISASIIAGAGYLKHAQSDITEDNAGNGPAVADNDKNDGGWDWVLTYPTVTHSAVSSFKNLYGVTALGIYYSYLRTNDASLKVAMDDAAGYIIADPGIRDAYSLKFLILYNTLPSVIGTAYRDAAKVKFDARITTYGSATQFAEYIRDVRGISQGYHNGIIAWDLGGWVEAASLLAGYYGSAYQTAAVDIAEVVYNSSYVANANYFYLPRCAGWDAGYAVADYYYYNLGLAGLLTSFRCANTHTDKIPGIVSQLYAGQVTAGPTAGAFSFCYGVHAADEDWQTTAYCVMALGDYYKSVGSSVPTLISSALAYLSASQHISGGWVYSDNTHYPEIGGECTSAFYYYDATASTAAVSSITQVNAVGGGTITYNGGVITALGVCWSTSHNPTIFDSHSFGTVVQTGSFTSTITGLIPGTTYYVRSYVSTSVGTSYGNEVSFTTLQNPTPSVVAPINGLTGVSILPYFQWNLSLPSYLSLLSYDIKIYDGATLVFSKNIPWSSTGIAFYQLLETDFVLLNNHNYTWSVTANYSVGASKSFTGTFTTVPAAQATIFTPTSGSTVYTYSPVMVTWSINQAVGALSFRVQYVSQNSLALSAPTTADWNNPAITTTVLAGGGLYLNNINLLSGTKYWFRVITNRGSEVVSFSNAIWFTTSGGAQAVSAIPSWPSGGSTVYTNTPTFYWYTTSGDLTDISFQVLLYKAGVLVNVYPAFGSTTTGLSFTPSVALEAGVSYTWKVVTYYKFGTAEVKSYTSAEASFITNGVGTLVKPVCSYPVGVTVYTQSPSFYWYLGAYSSGVTYTLYIDGAPEAVGVDQLNFTTTRVLAPGTVHTWFVRASSGASFIDSDSKTFTVAGGLVQGKPVVWWPVGNPTVYTQTPTLNWSVTGSTLGIEKFRIAWSTTPNPVWSSVVDYYETTNVNDRFYTMSSLPYGTHLYWAVAAYAGGSWSAWSTGEFTIVGGLGTIVPIASYPVGGVTVYSNSVNLSWYVNGSSAGIQHFKVEYARSSTFSDVVTVDNVTAQTLSLSSLVEGATYFWRVSAYNGVTYSTPSNVGIFTVATGAAAAVPLPGSPANGVTIEAGSPMISWILPTQQIENCTYELQYSDNQDMSLYKTVTGINSQSQVLSNLSSGKTYFWRVRSVDERGNASSFSQVAKFSVNSPLGVTEDKAIPFQYGLSQNYPNPFNPATIISYSLPQNSFVTIKVYDMIGREVKTLVSQNMSAGNHSIEWQADDNYGNKVASGTYLYRMTANDAVITKKLSFIK